MHRDIALNVTMHAGGVPSLEIPMEPIPDGGIESRDGMIGK
jgi:hypothetical protein